MLAHDTKEDWLQLIHAEYEEIPGLSLTREQVQRLWNLDAESCDMLLAEMEARRLVRRTPAQTYVRGELDDR